MALFTVHWGNRLEDLAGQMFSRLYGRPTNDPLTPCCIVTNSNIMQAWLKHAFVMEWPGRHTGILANGDFQLLYPFVNDWMDRLLNAPATGTGRPRNARHHPFSTGSLQWRIFDLLDTSLAREDGFAPVRAYLGSEPTPRRRFQLAGRLAALFDDYQVFRCSVLQTWEQGADPGHWQAMLWRALTREDSNSYAALFRSMNRVSPDLVRKRFDGAFRHVAVFGTTAMPIPYLGFLQRVLAQAVNVDLFVLNPSTDFWFDDVTPRRAEKMLEKLLLEDHPLKEDPLMLPAKGHPLLCSLGQAMQEHLSAVHDMTDGGVDSEQFAPAPAATLLADLQNRILTPADRPSAPRTVDDSLQIHICHNAGREVEILHDHLLHWFTHEHLQPYQIQVLVTDMETYGPLIDAVFGATPPHSTDAIPYEVDGRSSPTGSQLQNAFRALLNIASSRFTASDITDLLAHETVRTAIGLHEDACATIAEIINKAGIRWGLNSAHRQAVIGIDMEPYTSWEYGLERLLAGYALGSEDPDGDLWPVDTVENESAETLGKLAVFIEQLQSFHDSLRGDLTPPEWQQQLWTLTDTFFASTNETYGEVASIRNAIDEMGVFTEAAGLSNTRLPLDVIAAFLDTEIRTAPRHGGLLRNAVVFGPLRPMNARPADVICLLGMVDGVFPRNDNRPTFDLLQQTRRRGDRSRRRDDRCAFLEAILNARRRLFISYPGRSDRSLNIIPPSIVLQELRDYLRQTYRLDENHQKQLPLETLHRMQGTHPAYFHKEGKLFSYSRERFQAAVQMAGRHTDRVETATPAAHLTPDPSAETEPLALDTLIRFFKNPAKYYYRDRLKLVLDINDDGITRDDEPMTITALDRYALNEALLDQLQDNGYPLTSIDPASFTARSKANAKAPLGQAGDIAVSALMEETTLWLHSIPPDPPGCTLRILDLLKAQAAAADHESTLVFPAAIPARTPMTANGLSGGFKTVEYDGQRIQIFARPSGLKAKDRIGAWIPHLFACASGARVHTLIMGIDKGSPVTECYPPMPADGARACLRDLDRLFASGQQAPLPFAPASAYAYVKACQDHPDRPREALEKATRTWVGSPYQRGDGSDCWMSHAFGEEGPVAQPLFIDAANAFFKPLLEHLGNAGHQDMAFMEEDA